MKKTWIVLKTEFINTVTRRSFLLTLILVPLVPAIILGVVSLIGSDSQSGGIGQIFQPSPRGPVTDGYVDLAGVIEQLPPDINPDSLNEYQNEEAAKEAVMSDQLRGYYKIHADFLETGQITYYRKDFNPFSAMETTTAVERVIRYNLLGANLQQYEALSDPVQVNTIDLAPDVEERDTSNPLAFYLPYGVSMLFYVIIITSASLLMSSIAKEKENRVMEILMSSVKPIQLFTGKIFALGLVGLLQMVLWMGSGLLMLRLGGTTLNIPPSLQLPAGLLPWGIAFFITGYLVYATIMAGIGAFVPNLKEASQATFYVIAPILIPLMLVGVIIEQPNATLPTILSLIPFTAPTTIMTRMAVSPVPLWQLLVSIALLILTILLLIRSVAGMFRAQTLLTGSKFSLGLFIKTLFSAERT
ncbi:MAG: ABC transporter permease [Brevefilum sp.]|nr:ABC transporter permease [Brevefilum sp.]